MRPEVVQRNVAGCLSEDGVKRTAVQLIVQRHHKCLLLAVGVILLSFAWLPRVESTEKPKRCGMMTTCGPERGLSLAGMGCGLQLEGHNQSGIGH